MEIFYSITKIGRNGCKYKALRALDLFAYNNNNYSEEISRTITGQAIKQGLKGLYSPFKEQDICEEFNFIFLAK